MTSRLSFLSSWCKRDTLPSCRSVLIQSPMAQTLRYLDSTCVMSSTIWTAISLRWLPEGADLVQLWLLPDLGRLSRELLPHLTMLTGVAMIKAPLLWNTGQWCGSLAVMLCVDWEAMPRGWEPIGPPHTPSPPCWGNVKWSGQPTNKEWVPSAWGSSHLWLPIFASHPGHSHKNPMHPQ